ncbi:cell division protein ZapE [Legionella spiritensis]|uniref:ATPase N2B (Nucleotide (GTP) binding protein) n=1 Tax=Legionella spiritensis TaxID=452 RepID=A0A0W0Z7F7_LEGSP|nr:cell division protein ZapE [Legionella spiritensis]KTD64694.1 ATPase N2B (nucleotide (GTP) binding protein) [Legionella spiritensis]SNV47915.1 ATPase N2B (nucleotide (GTP) binding protein) [Legionella spiritensis]
MSIMAAYEAAITRGDIEDDVLQRPVITTMDNLAASLVKSCKSRFIWRRPQAVQGIYLYGPVGVGKTFLMDLFFEHVGVRQKIRFHFHHFMQQIDAQLRRLQGHKDPVQVIARGLTKTTRLLCFDEFLVHDVAHAMMLAELLKALFAHGITLVATSNICPDDLYLNGIHRARFLPAIALIKSRCDVMSLHNKRDYRLGRTPDLETFLFPLNETTRARFAGQFAQLVPQPELQGSLTVQNRKIPYVQCGERAIWFDFNVLCNLPRSQLDYLEIADRFDTVFVSDIPVLGERDTARVILLIHFIDVMYDRGIRLILSAAVSLPELYGGGEMSQSFKRTLSRLQEMQSEDYLRRHPRRAVQTMPEFPLK